MPEPARIIPAVKIFSIKEERTPAEIRENIRQAYDPTHQKLRAEAGAAFPRGTVHAAPFNGEICFVPMREMIESLANHFGLPVPPDEITDEKMTALIAAEIELKYGGYPT